MQMSPEQSFEPVKKLPPLAEALTSVFKAIELEGTRRETPTTFFENGRERVVVSNLERAIADMQASLKIAKEVLDTAIEKGEYRGEQAAAKAFATSYAEIFAQSPESAESIKKGMLKFFETAKPAGRFLVQPA